MTESYSVRRVVCSVSHSLVVFFFGWHAFVVSSYHVFFLNWFASEVFHHIPHVWIPLWCMSEIKAFRMSNIVIPIPIITFQLNSHAYIPCLIHSWLQPNLTLLLFFLFPLKYFLLLLVWLRCTYTQPSVFFLVVVNLQQFLPHLFWNVLNGMA